MRNKRKKKKKKTGHRLRFYYALESDIRVQSLTRCGEARVDSLLLTRFFFPLSLPLKNSNFKMKKILFPRIEREEKKKNRCLACTKQFLIFFIYPSMKISSFTYTLRICVRYLFNIVRQSWKNRKKYSYKSRLSSFDIQYFTITN